MKRNLNAVATRLGVGAVFLAAAVAVLGLGCAQLEGDQGPTVFVTGPTIEATGAHAVVIGSSVTITATTKNGNDATYTFTSEDASIATVDGSGVVTGIRPGETAITVMGDDTMASASLPIVVIEPTDASRIPYYTAWTMSAHSDSTALAFNNWNADGRGPRRPARAATARRASSTTWVATAARRASSTSRRPTQSVIRCVTCHNPAADALTSVTFPSGVTVDGPRRRGALHDLPPGARFRTGGRRGDHRGRAGHRRHVSSSLNFQNIHYFPAAATLYAGVAKGGYQYAGQVYDVRFRHVDGYNTCIGCHDPHSTKVKFDECAACHAGVTDVGTAHEIRMMSSVGIDYDGDGNTTEGIYDELVGLRDKLGHGDPHVR